MKRMLCVLAFFLCCISVLSVSAAQNVVSLHASYVLEVPASEGYPDTELELTNGKYGTPVANGDVSYYYRSAEFVGFQNSALTDNALVIVIDLGESFVDLTTFEISALTEVDAGIRAPKKVAFSVCETQDGDYIQAGEAVLNAAEDAQKVHILTAEVGEPLAGRYVRCEITPADNAAWTFLDEISVLQGKNNITEPSVSAELSDAPSVSVPSVSAPSVSGVISQETSSSGGSSLPSTGDAGTLRFGVLCIASALGVAALLGRRRRV